MLAYYLSLLETQEEKNTLELIYLNFRKHMKYKAFQILKNEDDAEDAVHETFLKLTKISQELEYPITPRVKVLIITILENTCLDTLRKRKKYVPVEDETLARLGKALLPDPQAELNADHIKNLIKRLSPTYRNTLLLRVYYNFSYKEIGDLLGITPATARKRMERARTILHQKINGNR